MLRLYSASLTSSSGVSAVILGAFMSLLLNTLTMGESPLYRRPPTSAPSLVRSEGEKSMTVMSPFASSMASSRSLLAYSVLPEPGSPVIRVFLLLRSE